LIVSQQHLANLLGSLDLQGIATIHGVDPILPTRFRAGDAAATALVAGGIAADKIWQMSGRSAQEISVETKAAAASLISFLFQSMDEAGLPIRDDDRALVDLYRTNDGRWVHLHGAFPDLAAGTLKVLKCDNSVAAVGAAVAQWKAQDLEDALATAGMCGAMARTRAEWLAHPQGQALEGIPPVEIIKIADSAPEPFDNRSRPLDRIRVLDLTRVLAGPTCARTLASHGAEVLKINSPELPSVPAFVIDTGHGKRSAHLDLNMPRDVGELKRLAADCDVFSQGYRAGALEARGFGPEDLAAERPGLIYVSINAYGHVGPWSSRPGWEQLAQTVCGVAIDEGGPESPRLIPAAATDYTTGYLASLGVMTALARRAKEGGSYHVRASLCQTANWLYDFGLFEEGAEKPEMDFGMAEPFMTTTKSGFGVLNHMAPVLKMSQTPPRWEQPTVPLGTHDAQWKDK
jgi:crotonobetainyl-CoA:carnitine CoA-transferase CaiB-like acyl-CoA transferase